MHDLLKCFSVWTGNLQVNGMNITKLESSLQREGKVEDIR